MTFSYQTQIPVMLLNNRPSANNYFNSTVLQEWTRATNVRFRFLRTKNLLGHLMSVQRQDPTVTRRVNFFFVTSDALDTLNKKKLWTFSTFTQSKIFQLVVGVCVTVMPILVTYTNRARLEFQLANASTTLAVSNVTNVVQDSNRRNGDRIRSPILSSVNVMPQPTVVMNLHLITKSVLCSMQLLRSFQEMYLRRIDR